MNVIFEANSRKIASQSLLEKSAEIRMSTVDQICKGSNIENQSNLQEFKRSAKIQMSKTSQRPVKDAGIQTFTVRRVCAQGLKPLICGPNHLRTRPLNGILLQIPFHSSSPCYLTSSIPLRASTP